MKSGESPHHGEMQPTAREADDDDKGLRIIAEVMSCQQEASCLARPCRTYAVLATHLAAAEIL